MAGPPKDVPPEDLWRKLSERPRPTTEIDFPSKGSDGQPIGRCKLWILTESELHVARAQADISARQIMGAGVPKGTDFSYGYEDIYRNELAIQLVAAACRNAGDPKYPLFQTPKHARQVLTSDELGVLAQAYQEFRVQSGPMLMEMEPEEMEAWLQRLQEGGAAANPLVSWDSAMLRQFIKFLVSKAATSSTGTGSAGSPPGDTSQPVAGKPQDLVDDSERAKPEQ